MSSSARRNEKRREREVAWQAEYDERMAEEYRKDQLDMYDRINEADASDDVKDILHRMAKHIGMEE